MQKNMVVCQVVINMQVVINNCYGGFGLSLKAIERFLELKGKEAYFYKQTSYSHIGEKDEYIKTTKEENSLMTHTMTSDLGDVTDNLPNECYFSAHGIDRTDPILIQVVEEMGEDANGMCAALIIIEIPDDIEYTIEEYDGIEHIAEKHRTWC